MTGPSIDPPIVTNGNLRLLLDEDAGTAVLRGLRLAIPTLFTFGSFDVPGDAMDPIEIELPTGGNMYFNYRVDLTKPAFDFHPTNKTIEGFPNPFTLQADQLGVFVSIVVTVSSHPIGGWREDLIVNTWLKGQFLPPDDAGQIRLRLLDAKVRIADITNVTVGNILNHIVSEYLSGSVEQFTFPIGGIFGGGIFKIITRSWTTHHDALDAHADVA